MNDNNKFRFAAAGLLVFVGVLVLAMVEHNPRFVRAVPIVGVAVLIYIIFCVVSLLRSGNRPVNPDGSLPNSKPKTAVNNGTKATRKAN